MYRTSTKARWVRSLESPVIAFTASLCITLLLGVCVPFAPTAPWGIFLSLGTLFFAVPAVLLGPEMVQSFRGRPWVVVDDNTVSLPSRCCEWRAGPTLTGPTMAVPLVEIQAALLVDVFSGDSVDVALRLSFGSSEIEVSKASLGRRVFDELVEELESRGLEVQVRVS